MVHYLIFAILLKPLMQVDSIFEKSSRDSGEVQCDGLGGRESSRLFSLLSRIFLYEGNTDTS